MSGQTGAEMEDGHLTVRSRAALRDWLAAHHDSHEGPLWLATYKKHHPDYLP